MFPTGLGCWPKRHPKNFLSAFKHMNKIVTIGDGDTISISLSERADFEIEEKSKKCFKKQAQMEIAEEVVGCSSLPSTSTGSFRKCTSFRLDPPLANPVDITVSRDQIIAIADYDNGVHFVDFMGRIIKHLTTPYKICGVRFRHYNDDLNNQLIQVIFLGYLDQNWFIIFHSWPDLKEEHIIECLNNPQIFPWARRKITILEDTLYLLGTCESCSTIWTLNFSNLTWKTLIVERWKKNARTKPGSYSDFDVKRWSKEERRIVLCEMDNSRLQILSLSEEDRLTNSRIVKVKRRKSQKWIVQGPKLAIWDNEKDIIVYDGSGKLFWFDDTYKIQKIIGDLGRSEVCALDVKNGWCYALCRHRLCIHAFLYRNCTSKD